MRIDQLYIPGIRVGVIEHQGNNYDVASVPHTICVPVLIVFFQAPTTTLADKTRFGRNVSDAIRVMRDFYLENSFGQFTFECPLRTCELQNPRSWKGNLVGIEPHYDANGILENADEFPSVESYTGYAESNPGLNTVFLDRAQTEPFRDYTIQGENNMFEDAIRAAQTSPSYSSSWDDNMSYEEWLNSGIPRSYAEKACLIFASPDWGGGNYKSILNIDLPDSRRIHRKITFRNGWQELAHELGHFLFEYPFSDKDTDLYERSPSDESPAPITRLMYMGYLGRADLMGLHTRGSHFNAFFKLVVGWLDPELFVPNRPSMIKRLSPVYSNPTNALVIRSDLHQHEDELFLVEVRGANKDRYGNPISRDWQGNRISFDRNLDRRGDPTSIDNGVFVYHVNTQNFTGGNTVAGVARAEPIIDLEGEDKGSTVLRVLRTGDCLETWQTCFYDGYESGLELEVLSAEDDGTHELRLSWNCNPRLSAVTSGRLTFLFGRDDAGRPVYKVRDADRWFPSTEDWLDLGGKIEGHPVAMSYGPVDVFVRAKSGEPLTKRFENGSTEPSSRRWTPLGGEIRGMASLNRCDYTTQPYAAMRRVSNRVIVLWRRDDEDWASSAAHWFDLGGDVLGSPAITRDRQGRLHVFARSRSNMPLHKYQDNAGRWQPSSEDWFELGGEIDADPVAIADQDDFSVYVFARGIRGEVLYKQLDGRAWSPGSADWTNLGGQALGPPVAVQDSDGVVHIFVTDISHQVFHKRLQSGRWYPSPTEWDTLGGQVLDSPAATALGVSEVVDIFVTGTNGEVLQKTWRRGRWISDWISLGIPRPLSFSLRAIASDAGFTGDFKVRELAEHSDFDNPKFTLRELIDIVDP